ncbi:hypothetical protein [Streptomyces sp. enrichment culture]|uniref:hypothetical protein n=1 Tax=Streptomyces sp. enrichment culture TaxID=1795815 RepID=UPI003F5712C4
MNFLYWAAFGLIMLGAVLAIVAGVKGSAKVNRVGATALLTGSLANVAYYVADENTGMTVLFAVLSAVNLATFFLAHHTVRKQAAAK